MFIFVFFLIYFVLQLSKKHLLTSFMALLILFQLSLCFILEQTPPYSITIFLTELLHIIILYILIKPFEYYHIKGISGVDELKFSRFSKILGGMNLVCLVISSAIVFLVWSVIENYSQFKGQPDVEMEFFSNLPIPTKLFTLSYILGSSYFFCIPMHFYYMLKGEKKLSILFLVLSLSFPVRMLVYFSRSNLILLILLYISYALIIYPILNKGSKRLFRISVLTIFGAIFSVTAIISINRFGEVTKESSIFQKEGTLYKTVDYASQWYTNTVVMEDYDLDKIQWGELSDILFDKLGLSGGKTNREVRAEVWPRHYVRFIPYPIVMVYDFGIILTFLITILVSFVIYSLRPRQGVISFPSFLAVGLMASIPLMNFEGCMFEELYFHYALIYLLLIFNYFKRKKRVTQSVNLIKTTYGHE